jgi:hypothetical protein
MADPGDCQQVGRQRADEFFDHGVEIVDTLVGVGELADHLGNHVTDMGAHLRGIELRGQRR